jgi:TonB family protein
MRIFVQQRIILTASAVTFLSQPFFTAHSVFANNTPSLPIVSDTASSSAVTITTTPKPANKLIDTDVSTDTLIYDRAKSKAKKGDLNGAISDLSSLLQKDPNKPLYLRERANYYWQMKDFQKAMSDITADLQIEPENAWSLDIRGLIKLGLGDADGAVADMTKAISLEKRPDWVFRYYYNRGTALQRQGKNREAIEDFNSAISIEPSYALAYSARGLSQWRLKEPDKAVADYDKAIQLNSQDSYAYANRAIVKFYKADYKGALIDQDKALAINPTDVNALRARGKTKDALGDSDGAIADYNQAIKMNASPHPVPIAVFAVSPHSLTGLPAAATSHGNLSGEYGAAGDLKTDQKEANAKYMAMLQSWVKGFWTIPASNVSKSATVSLSTDFSGNVSDVKIKVSSGDPLFDAGAVSAVKDASPIPTPPSFFKVPIPIDLRFAVNGQQH